MSYCKLLMAQPLRRSAPPWSSAKLTQEPRSICGPSCQAQLGRRYRHETVVRVGLRHVLDPHYNKGLAFSMEERQRLNVNGLFPCVFRTQDEQLYAAASNFQAQRSNLGRYRYMMALRSRHERLYYRFISKHIEDVLPIIYTPTVGVACRMFGVMFANPLGLYVTKYDRGHILDVLRNWTEPNATAVCVTDGERILGLGDLGANGMGITVGKLDLYTALGRVDPHDLVPITLDVGTDNEQLLADPLYIGARDKRLRGEEYDDFVQEFMEAVINCWGRHTLIHFEDFATPNAFKILRKYQRDYCCFNDDIQGTGATVLAGLLGVERTTQKPLNEHVILFVGAGSAALGIVDLLLKHLALQGMNEEEALLGIYLFDVDGLLTSDRQDIPTALKPYAKDIPAIAKLEDVVEELKPSILLGATGMGGLFTEQILCSMARNHERPAVFALSNPTSKSECTAEQAFTCTEGRVIFCSGSPFPPVLINEKRFTPGQANNCFAFPGVALGAIVTSARYIPDEAFVVAAHALGNYANEERVACGEIYPCIKDATDVAFHIGVAVAQYLFDRDLARQPRPGGSMSDYVSSQLYDTEYGPSLAAMWEYPKLPHVPLPEGIKIIDDDL